MEIPLSEGVAGGSRTVPGGHATCARYPIATGRRAEPGDAGESAG